MRISSNAMERTICERKVMKRALKYRIDGNLVYISCNKNKEFVIDIDDFDLVKQFRWHIPNNGYVTENEKKIYLHRLLTNPKSSEVVDHINKNKLDNRRINLRITNYSINGINKVCKSKLGEPYITYYKGYYKVVIDKKYRGCSKYLEKAIAIRNEALKGSKALKYNTMIQQYLEQLAL